jgi:hypothetical protein
MPPCVKTGFRAKRGAKAVRPWASGPANQRARAMPG